MQNITHNYFSPSTVAQSWSILKVPELVKVYLSFFANSLLKFAFNFSHFITIFSRLSWLWLCWTARFKLLVENFKIGQTTWSWQVHVRYGIFSKFDEERLSMVFGILRSCSRLAHQKLDKSSAKVQTKCCIFIRCRKDWGRVSMR